MKRRAFYLVLFVLLAMVAAFNVLNLSEAYGSGPPYYSRTTNMDKWVNPVPVLAAVDAFTALALAGCVFFLRRTR